MRFNDAIFGIVLVVFALAEIAYTQTFPRLHGQDYGPDLFPVIIGSGLIICGIILIVQRHCQSRRRCRWLSRRLGAGSQQCFECCAIARLHGLLHPGLGLAGLHPHLAADPDHAAGAARVRLAASLIVAVAATLVIHTVFAKVLLVPLPWGILLPVAW